MSNRRSGSGGLALERRASPATGSDPPTRRKNMYLPFVYALPTPTAHRRQHVRLAFELPPLERPQLRKIGSGRSNESFCCDQWG